MKRKAIHILALGLLLGAAWSYPGKAGVLLLEDFEGITSPVTPGQLATVLGKRGWSTGRGGDQVQLDSVPYLRFPVPGSILPQAGTIELQLVRRRSPEIEALFALVGADGTSHLVAEMHWEKKGPPTLWFSGRRPLTTWRSVPLETWSNRRELGPSILPNRPIPVVQLPKAIPVNQRYSLAFRWGPLPEDCAIFLDGEPLHLAAPDPSSIRGVIEDSASLVIGAEPAPGAKGGYSLLSGVVQAVRISDQPLHPSQFLLFPRIRSLSHDALRVAGYSGFLVEGQTISLVLEADPGGTATCDVGEVRGIPLSEVPDIPGRYVGGYTVRAGDFAARGAVVGHFRNAGGLFADPFTAQRPASLDGRVHLKVRTSNDLVAADRSSKVGITVVAADANGRKLRDRALRLTLSTTEDYTGMAGAGAFKDEVGGRVEVDWGGVTDSFGEVTAQYMAGFAAKTAILSAKDLGSGDMGLGFIRSFVEGRIDISVREPEATRLMAGRGILEATASRSWLTADGSSRSRITARVLSTRGTPVQGNQVTFTLVGARGKIKVIQGRTDSSGYAYADYIAGTLIGQVQIEVRDLTLGLFALVPIELRADAPAKVTLTAETPSVFLGGKGTALIARVTDANGNPSPKTDVLFALVEGTGKLSAEKAVTDAREGKAVVRFGPGDKAGIATVRATVISRAPTEAELANARGAVFLTGLTEDPGTLVLEQWKAEPGDQVLKGQELATLVDRRGNLYPVKASRDGVLSARIFESGEETRLGDSLAYLLGPSSD